MFKRININEIQEGYHLRKDFTGQEELKGIIEKEGLDKQPIDEIVAKTEISTEKVKEKVNVRLSAEKREKEDREVIPEIPQGDIPGVFFKDARDMSELKDESVGLIVTSPPYCVNLEYENGVSFKDHVKNLESVFTECVRMLKPGGKICINFGDIRTFGTRTQGKPEIQLMGHVFQEILRKHKVRLIDTITWKKCTKGKRDFNWVSNPQASYNKKKRHTTYRIINNTEYVHIFEKNGKPDVDSETEKRSKISKEKYYEWNDSVWEIPPVKGKKDHPAPFPEELPHRLITLYSYIGDIVLDPFGGTLTTVKVANDLGRVGIAYERKKEYKSTIMKKLGIKEEDLKKSDMNAGQQEKNANGSDFVDHLAKSVGEILATEHRGEEDIRSIKVPYQSDFSKDEIVIDWTDDPEEPDPSGSINFPAVVKADDYEDIALKKAA